MPAITEARSGSAPAPPRGPGVGEAHGAGRHLRLVRPEDWTPPDASGSGADADAPAEVAETDTVLGRVTGSPPSAPPPAGRQRGTGTAEPLEDVVRTLASLPADLQRAVRDAVVAAAAMAGSEHSGSRIPDPAPPARASVDAAVQSAFGVHAALEQLAGRSLRVVEAAMRLGIDEDSVRERASAGSLVAFDHGAELLLPGWQFDEHQPGGVLPALAELQSTYPGTALGLTGWMTAPHGGLDGRTPRELLADGEVERVIWAARALHG